MVILDDDDDDNDYEHAGKSALNGSDGATQGKGEKQPPQTSSHIKEQARIGISQFDQGRPRGDLQGPQTRSKKGLVRSNSHPAMSADGKSSTSEKRSNKLILDVNSASTSTQSQRLEVVIEAVAGDIKTNVEEAKSSKKRKRSDDEDSVGRGRPRKRCAAFNRGTEGLGLSSGERR